MTNERAEHILSTVKRIFNAVYIAFGIAIIGFVALTAALIALSVCMIWIDHIQMEEDKIINDCVHIQGVPGCYKNPDSYYGGPHNPNRHSHFSPQAMPAYEHRTR